MRLLLQMGSADVPSDSALVQLGDRSKQKKMYLYQREKEREISLI